MRSKSLVIGADLAACGGGPRNDDVTNDVEPLQGGWTMVLVFGNGEEAPADQAKTGEARHRRR